MLGSGAFRAAVVGGLLALVTVGLAFAYVARPNASRTTAPEQVVVIIESKDSDGATGASLIGLVSGGRMQDVDPGMRAVVSGASGSTLGDAYIFGGPEAVVSALGTASAPATVGYLAIPQRVWMDAINQSGGLQVELPASINTFNGNELFSLGAGPQVLSAPETAAVLTALPYFSPTDQGAVRVQLGRAICRVVGGIGVDVDDVHSDIPRGAFTDWIRTRLAAPMPL